jgi:ammonia channel protein AmtB
MFIVGLANWLGYARGFRRIESIASFVAICIAAVFSYIENLGAIVVGLLAFSCIFSAIDLVSKWNHR